MIVKGGILERSVWGCLKIVLRKSRIMVRRIVKQENLPRSRLPGTGTGSQDGILPHQHSLTQQSDFSHTSTKPKGGRL